MEPLEQAVKRVLVRFPAIREAFIFGSCAQGRQTSESDLDLAVVCTPPLPVSAKMAIMEALAVEVGRPVDLVDLGEAAAPLLREVLTSGRSLFDRLDFRVDLTLRLLDLEADVMPAYRQAQRERLEAFAHG